ncbi:MAG: hypothetical protein QMD77_04085 [Patescibacteria group bacterium]|nr:hypothetical protein [Patescibacteria group bacterium]
MPRRKTSKKNTKENKKKAFALDFGGRQSETRFKISLIFLIAALLISVFIFGVSIEHD